MSLLVLTCIAFLSLLSRFRGGFLLRSLGMIPPEMVALPGRVPALRRGTVPVVMPSSLPGLLLARLLLRPRVCLPGFRWLLLRGIRAGFSLLGLVCLFRHDCPADTSGQREEIVWHRCPF